MRCPYCGSIGECEHRISAKEMLDRAYEAARAEAEDDGSD